MKTEKLLTNIYAITSRRKNLGGSLKYGAGPRALNWRALCTLLARLQWRRWRSSWITMVVMRSFTDHNGELIACCWAGPYGFHGDGALHAYSWDIVDIVEIAFDDEPFPPITMLAMWSCCRSRRPRCTFLPVATSTQEQRCLIHNKAWQGLSWNHLNGSCTCFSRITSGSPNGI